MSRRLIEKYRQRLAAESGSVPKPWGGRLSVALVYPNSYHQGMSNLGLHAVYQLFNDRDDCLCERFFLPDPEDLAEHRRTGFPLHSLESQKPLADFDLVAFSISFENDYVNLPVIFELGQLPFLSEDRNAHHPLVLCGGVCAFLNPEPLAEVMDLFAVGEAEAILPGFLDRVSDSADLHRDELLVKLATIPGLYVPSLYSVDYDESGRFAGFDSERDVPARIVRQWQRRLDDGRAHTVIDTPGTEFGGMQLVEASRGCPRACRFCAAGFIYRPFREHSPDHLQETVSRCLETSDRIGLVAAAISDYRQMVDVGVAVLAQGGQVSISSVRIDAVTPDQVRVLKESGHKTLALAPEAGSQRLRDVINKGVDEEQILGAVKILAEGGIPNLKLYFMIGLPGETKDDIEAILELTGKIRDAWEIVWRRHGTLGRLVLSVNPFVPKPWTPLQWAGMEPRSSLEKKYRFLQKAFRSMPNVDLNTESLRGAELQGLLARGDRRIATLLPLLSDGHSLKAACRSAGLDVRDGLYRERSKDEAFPWEIIDQGILRSHLRKEYEDALAAIPGQLCHPGCQRCGIGC